VTVTYNLAGKLVPGTHGNSGKAALVWGPIVLAYDEALNPGLPHASLLGLVVEPVTIARVVFAHGRTFHDGGWFDTSRGKPRIQIQRTQDGVWETVDELEAYPGTTAQSPGVLQDGQLFSQPLKEPVRAVALRVLGKPACGDNPSQAFSSCAELQAF
jgi:hypothetical protein